MSASPRISYVRFNEMAAPARAALLALGKAVDDTGLDKALTELVKVRVSQINGCAYCMDMHWNVLVKNGMEPRHLNAVAGWREAPFFSDRDRAALRWAEILTATPNSDASDEEFARLQAVFSEAEISELGFAVGVINAWNLVNAGMRAPIPEAPAV